MNYSLPKSLEVGGREYAIRWDFRAALDICVALSANDLDGEEKALACLMILYPDFDEMPRENYAEALKQCMWFINCGEEEREKPRRKLMDWEQDFPLIISPISRVLGEDVRGIKELHWWSFIAAYMEIGDCFFAQVVGIRVKKAKGQKLTKEEKAFARDNADIINIRTHYTEAEDALLAEWGGVKDG